MFIVISFILLVLTYFYFLYKKNEYVNVNDYGTLNNLKKDDMLNIIKSKKFVKLDVDNNDYNKVIKTVEIYEDELINFEFELFKEFAKNFKIYDHRSKNQKSSLDKITKKKIYIKPNFSQKSYSESLQNTNNININDQNTSSDIINYDLDGFDTKFTETRITLNEFNETFKANNNNKIDMLGISKTMLSDLPDIIKQQLINKYNKILENPESAKNYNIGKNSFVYKNSKNGKTNELKSFRQVISIPCVISHFHRILALRLNDYMLKNKLIDTTLQKAGISGIKLGIFEQIVKLKNLIKHAHNKKNELSLTFIDISDAFPSISIKKLCQVLEKYKIPNFLIKYIANYYSSFTYYTTTKDWNSENIVWNKGLLQGCPLSCILFVTVIDYILKFLENKYKNKYAYELETNKKLLFLAYVDDIVLVSNNEKGMQEMYLELEKILIKQ